jgi:hypothetical protein
MDERSYFRVIEDHFIRLRGAPLLLSPTDFQVARQWRREGIPVELVMRAIDEVFERRAERGTQTPVQSLRYCASAVEAAWHESSKMEQAGRRETAEPLDTRARLAALAASIPERLEGARAVRDAVEGLAESGGAAEEVEASLAALDGQLMTVALDSLDNQSRAALEGRVERGINALGGRLTAEETEVARQRLREQALRRELELPLLSLFAQ